MSNVFVLLHLFYNQFGDVFMNQNTIIPQHRKVYEILRSHIAEGVFHEGDLLPSENELCTVHGVTRPTIRKALDRLANEGYIVRHQGKGSIVKGVPKGVGILSLTGTTSCDWSG